RLMNCLRYEHAVYTQAKKRFPAVGKRVRTADGEEQVKAWDLFEETVTLQNEQGEQRTVPLSQLKAERRAARGADTGA
ncbi:MAG: tpl protein, partial [Gemmatimonadetes bacterium]|nr:tpl protein [Gemmatimonadota bacterium]